MSKIFFLDSIEDLEALKLNTNLVLTIGNFDGVHIGHRHLLNKTINYANTNNIKSGAVIFNVHPRVFFKKLSQYEIFDLQTKINILSETNLDYIFVLNFANFYTLEGKDFFIKALLGSLKMKALFIGKDFKFGNDFVNATGLQTLATENSIFLNIVDDFNIEEQNIKVSSSYIRELLANGQIDKANTLLSKPFSVTAPVIKGKQLGRTLGFNTANMVMQNNTLLKAGGYLSKVTINNISYCAISNYGIRPTVSDEKVLLLETHILNFNQDIYNKIITVELLKYIREEKKFANLVELVAHIKNEIEYAKKFFNI